MVKPANHPDITWTSNPMTWHFVDHFLEAGPGAGSNTSGADSLETLFKDVSSLSGVLDIVTTAVIAKFRAKFDLVHDVPVSPSTQLVDLGIDSLVAVDIRAWFRKELGVDIPLLQIMGGASIEVLVLDAVGKVDGGRFPAVRALLGGDKDTDKEVNGTTNGNENGT